MRGYSIDREDYLLRLRKIEGQVRGLQRMINDDTYAEGTGRACQRFDEAILWLLTPPDVAPVRLELPVEPPPVATAPDSASRILPTSRRKFIMRPPGRNGC